jgi:hypothetical protein
MMSRPPLINRLDWVLILFAGIFLLLIAQPLYMHRYDQRGFGLYGGVFQCRMIPYKATSRWTVQGRSRLDWRWTFSGTIKYEHLEIEIEGTDGLRTGILDLRTMQYTDAAGSVMLDADWLTSTGLTAQESSKMMVWFVSVREGKLPSPRHHPIRNGKPMEGHLVHFSTGQHLPYTIGWWCGIWLVLTLAIGAWRAIQADNHARPHAEGRA